MPAVDALDALDTAPCALFRITADGTFLRVNRTFCQWVGFSAAELIGLRRFQDLLTAGGRIFLQTHWTPLLQMQGSVSEVKLAILPRDGTQIPMVLNAVRREEGGAVFHDVAAYVARDRDKYERELIQTQRRLQDAVSEATALQAQAKERARFAEQLVGIVSHDLRSPLGSIAMAEKLLASEVAPDKQRKLLDVIHRSTDRAMRLVDDLLDFTRGQVGQGLSVTVGSLDLHETMAHALDELALAFPRHSLQHEYSGSGTCAADAGRLVQLVGNLVANAAAYGDPDSQITLTSVVQDTSFWISVHNRGPAIPESMQAKIFEPMVRDDYAAGSDRSVGLGLYIVAQIAKAHGGTTSVASSAEEGTTFLARFPR